MLLLLLFNFHNLKIEIFFKKAYINKQLLFLIIIIFNIYFSRYYFKNNIMLFKFCNLKKRHSNLIYFL